MSRLLPWNSAFQADFEMGEVDEIPAVKLQRSAVFIGSLLEAYE